MDFKVNEPLKWRWRKLLNYFVQGLIILAPIIVTCWAIFSLFVYVDNFLPDIIYSLFPTFYKLDEAGKPIKIPGIGFGVIVILIVVVGWFSTSYVVGKVVDFFGHVLERTPGIRFIYTSVKDFLEAFAGEKRKFDKPVLVNVDANDVWRMGFMTQESGIGIGLKDHVVVYVPHSYAVSGVVYIVPIEKVKFLTNLSSTDAMKFALSGGVAEIAE
ncbi:MAG: transporter [Segetibacter sp.]|jgi:uncharacterized membrane protein|nr:transporter [Segetibacter sp.]